MYAAVDFFNNSNRHFLLFFNSKKSFVYILLRTFVLLAYFNHNNTYTFMHYDLFGSCYFLHVDRQSLDFKPIHF